MAYQSAEVQMDQPESVLNVFVQPTDQGTAGTPRHPIFASLNLPDQVVKDCTRHDIYALGLGPETMQLLNLATLRPARATEA